MCTFLSVCYPTDSYSALQIQSLKHTLESEHMTRILIDFTVTHFSHPHSHVENKKIQEKKTTIITYICSTEIPIIIFNTNDFINPGDNDI